MNKRIEMYEYLQDTLSEPPKRSELVGLGFTWRESIKLKVMDVAAVFVQETPNHGSELPSRLAANLLIEELSGLTV